MSTMPSRVIAPKPVVVPNEPTPKFDRLALLYEGIFTAIVRVHTGRHASRGCRELPQSADTGAAGDRLDRRRAEYSAEDVQERNFAVVAFLDEAILTAPDNNASQWAGKSLGEELFDQRSAGELFFKRLETLRANRDSQELAEVLEVYYLCLLLGYEGKFAGGPKAELQLLMTNLRERIERIFGRNPEFSPDAVLVDEPIAMASPVDPLDRQVKLFAAAAFVFAILCFVVFSMQLGSKSTEIEHAAQERMTSR